jgi:hypothetical protein
MYRRPIDEQLQQLIAARAPIAEILSHSGFAQAYSVGHEGLWPYFRDARDLFSLVRAITESHDKKIPRVFQSQLSASVRWAHQIFSGSNSACVFALREAGRQLGDRPFISFALMNSFCHVLTLQFDITAALFQCRKNDSGVPLELFLLQLNHPVLQSHFAEIFDDEHSDNLDFFVWHVFCASLDPNVFRLITFTAPPRLARETYFDTDEFDRTSARRIVLSYCQRRAQTPRRGRDWRSHFLTDSMRQVLEEMADQYWHQSDEAWRAFCGDYLEIAGSLDFSDHFCRRAKLFLAPPESADGLARGLEYFDGVALWLEPNMIGAIFWRAFRIDGGETPPSLQAIQAVKSMLDKAFSPSACPWAWRANAIEVLRWFPVVWNECSEAYLAARQGDDVVLYERKVVMTQLVNIGIEIHAKVGDRPGDDWNSFAEEVLRPWETDTGLAIDQGRLLQVATSEDDLNTLQSLLAPDEMQLFLRSV